MATYITTADFWLHGNIVKAGSEVELSDADAKYRMHHLTAPKAEEPSPAAEPVADKRKNKAKPDIEDVKATEDGDA